MRIHRWNIWAPVLIALTACAVAPQRGDTQQKGGEDLTGPYEVVRNWPKPMHEGWTWGSVAAVWAESPDRVFIFQRGELPVLEKPVGSGGIPTRVATGAKPRWQNCLVVFDREGNVVESWRQHDDKFVRPHRIAISPFDPERHVWLVDDGAHQVFKFTNDGSKLLMMIGEKGKPGNGEYSFHRPTDIAFLPNGDVLVTERPGRLRIIRDGALLPDPVAGVPEDYANAMIDNTLSLLATVATTEELLALWSR